MRKIHQWKHVLAMLAIVLSLYGCGGGHSSLDNGSNNNIVNYTPNYDNQPDTYNIAEILNGEWIGVRGSGTAKGPDGNYTLTMTSLQYQFSNTIINNNTGTTTSIGSQEYKVFDQDGVYALTFVLYNDETSYGVAKMIHVGSNTWRCEYPDGTVLTFTVTSNTTIIAKQEGITEVYGYTYSYVIDTEVIKRSTNTPDTTTENHLNNNEKIEAEYNVTNLLGYWSTLKTYGAELGTGTTSAKRYITNSYAATVNVDLRQRYVNARFGEFDNDAGIVYAQISSLWDGYYRSDGVSCGTVSLESGNRLVRLERIGKNMYSFEFPTSGTKVTIAFISENVINVLEEGTRTTSSGNSSAGHTYQVQYTLAK